jgi:hypothetical protein
MNHESQYTGNPDFISLGMNPMTFFPGIIDGASQLFLSGSYLPLCSMTQEMSSVKCLMQGTGALNIIL